MEKRYQVFISSTFIDLVDERKKVMETILNLDCFPAGMEMFPASDKEQFDYIKSVIDQSDYYILILGARYGSTDDDGVSFTEKEYDYALASGIPILTFVLKDLDKVTVGKTDKDTELQQKLDLFRKKATKSKMVSFWDDEKDLLLAINNSLNKAKKMHPRDGWVKGNIDYQNIMIEKNNLNDENKKLLSELDEYYTIKKQIAEKKKSATGLYDRIHLKVTFENEKTRRVDFSLSDMLIFIGRYMFGYIELLQLKIRIENYIEINIVKKPCEIKESDLNSIIMKLLAYKIVDIDLNSENYVFGTEYGKELILDYVAKW